MSSRVTCEHSVFLHLFKSLLLLSFFCLSYTDLSSVIFCHISFKWFTYFIVAKMFYKILVSGDEETDQPGLSAYCSFRGSELESQHPHQATPNLP